VTDEINTDEATKGHQTHGAIETIVKDPEIDLVGSCTWTRAAIAATARAEDGGTNERAPFGPSHRSLRERPICLSVRSRKCPTRQCLTLACTHTPAACR
jgi:hypothetical protein